MREGDKMKPEKISHLNEDELLREDVKKHTVLTLPNEGGKIVSYLPFKNMQLIFFDVNTSALPDMWKLRFRRGDDGRYLRTLVCKSGSCDFTVKGATSPLCQGQVMMDYSVGDDKKFTFTTERFTGVEISMQVDTLVQESPMFKMLRLVIESMGLPEEEIFDADGYVFRYSKNTGQTLDKLLAAAFEEKATIFVVAQVVEIGQNLGDDLKAIKNPDDKVEQIAEDIYLTLTENFGDKITAAQFAEKYGVSDTTVKSYFKAVYGYGFKEFQTKVRMEWAAKMLSTSNMKVGEISEAVGYARHTKFSKAFKAYYGETPLTYRHNRKMESAASAAKNKEEQSETDY